jgi:gag-polyprotein putative aspartyl protease
MVRGGFDNHGRSIVRADVVPPAGVIQVVTFLIDTGAVSTIIMPNDASRLQVDFGGSPAPRPLEIGGGSLEGNAIKISIRLVDSGTVHTYHVDAYIIDPRRYRLPYPSILGQRAWSRWRMIIDSSVEIDPINPDEKDPP